MLDILRANTKSFFTWLIVVGIVVVFAVNFGPGSLSKGGCGGSAPPYAARVNGKVLPAADWERQYRQLYQIFRQQAGEAFSRELADQLGLGQQAMDQIVDRELVVQDARRRGVVVTRQELTKAVHAIPAFQENGQFRFDVYEENARALYGSPGKFEAAMKDDLLYQKMISALRETVKVPDSEVRAAWESDADRVNVAFVRIPLAAAGAEAARPTDAEVEAFAVQQAARVAKFHAENPARFDQKRKVRVRHVLARAAPGADDSAAKQRIADAAARVKKGEDFGKVARELSEDANTRERGGELGFVSEGLFDEAFAKAALALEPGQVSEPVRTPSGWHLVKAEEVVPAKKVSLEQARTEIARELLVEERARKLAGERAAAALEAARRGKALAELFPAASEKGKRPVVIGGQTISADETGLFSRGTPLVPKLGDVPGLLADAFAARSRAVLPRTYETPTGPVVAVVEQREIPDAAAFAAQRASVEGRLRNRKEAQVQGAWLKELRSAAKIEVNPTLASASARVEE